MAAVRPVASSAMAGTHGICVWMTGPPRAGKSTIARLVVEQRQAAGHSVVLIDDAEVRVLTHDRDPAASAAQVVSYLEDAA